jgi:hypothetical protein
MPIMTPVDVARRFWRTIEREAGWACHHGLTQLDRHPTMQDSLRHLSEIAALHAPSQVFAHYLDGRIESVAVFDRPL